MSAQRAGRFVEDAYRLAGLGWALIRLDGKIPKGKDWQHTEPLRDPHQAAGLWSEWGKRWNMGTVLGAGNLAVLEYDLADAHPRFLELIAGTEPPLCRTGSGKHHAYFAAVNGVTKAARDGLELRVGAHQCVVPPSVHPDTGEPYVWERAPWDVTLPTLPGHVVAYFAGAADELRERLQSDPGAKVNPGQRRDQVFRLACSLVARGVPHEAILSTARAFNETRCDPPLEDVQVVEQVDGAVGRYEPATALATKASAELTRASESPESVGGSGGVETVTDSLTQPYRVSESESLPPVTVGSDLDPESVTVPDRPFSLPVSEFIARERETAEPLLADSDGRPVIARRSLVLLGALGGHGKTTYAVDVFLHLAAGVDYPPFLVPRPVSILLIENEGPEEMFAEKLEARLASFPHELKARLDVCTFDWGGFSLADAEHLARLTREIAEKGYDLVFGDPLDALGIEGVGSPEDTRKFVALMKETGLNRTVAWWLNTHPRKEETKEALNEISGAWGGKPDSVLLLRMLDDDRTQVRFPKLRWARRGKRPTILLAFDADTEAFTYLGEQSEEERDYKAEILELLADGAWRTPKEIALPKDRDGIGANVDIVKKILDAHPDVFESRTGEAAKEIGRSPQATVWQLLREQLLEEDE